MPKTIAIFTDGTGNSARSLFKTNVWKLYQALDLAQLAPEEAPASETQQIAYYQDGIGTSTVRPLAIIGGAFGWGLKRNVIDAYIYLCRTYAPGDRGSSCSASAAGGSLLACCSALFSTRVCC